MRRYSLGPPHKVQWVWPSGVALRKGDGSLLWNQLAGSRRSPASHARLCAWQMSTMSQSMTWMTSARQPRAQPDWIVAPRRRSSPVLAGGADGVRLPQAVPLAGYRGICGLDARVGQRWASINLAEQLADTSVCERVTDGDPLVQVLAGCQAGPLAG